VWCGVFLSFTAIAQASPERKALNSLNKAKWERARGQVAKALRKDSTNATARYVLSLYYFSPLNPSFQIDSAYRHAMGAMSSYKVSNAKQRDRMKRFPLDSMILTELRVKIDSAAFERAKIINTERAYLEFLERFPFAVHRDRAMELRDEVAFIDALKENTYESYLSFLTRYPDASRAGEARDRYEKLLFEALTKDRKLASYESFVSAYPASPYRTVSETQIFEISTASGKPAAFMDFMKRYPDSKLNTTARNIVYHLLLEDEKAIPSHILVDSIRNMRKLEQGYLVPFLKDGLFGFMNAEGKEVIKAFARDLDSYYLCGNIIEDVLVAGGRVIARNGSVLLTGEITEIDDLGYGFILAVGKDCSWLIHKSGMLMDKCVDDARVLSGSYLLVRKNGKWSLMTLAGRNLPVGDFEDADALDEVLVFRMQGKYRLIKKEELARLADQGEPTFSRPFDEVKRWEGNLVWVRVGEQQGLLDMNLKDKIALGRREILPSFFGAISKLADGYRLWSPQSGQSEVFQDVRVQKPWIAARKDNRWFMLDSKNFKPAGIDSFDSVYFHGAYGMGVRADSLRAYFTPDSFIRVPARANLQFLPGRDSTFYLLIEEGEKKTVYDFKGERLFTVNFERIEFVGENLFLVVRREKRGLINMQGKPVIPLEYDAMGTLNHGSLPVLKDRKFGFVDVINRKEIKPVYEKNLLRFSRQHLVAFKGGLYGIINWNNKNITPFEYEEIRYWNDSTALVKKNFQWIIYNFVEKKVIADKIRSFRWLRDTEGEKLIIVNQEGNYGVISSTRGFVLQSTYSDIVNIGSQAQPLYFTEKHVEEASIYVVIYYDANGTLLRRQVFEVEDYERIYCSNN
jgi:hypothetical protein